MSSDNTAANTDAANSGNQTLLLVLTWLWVGVPFLYGVYSLLTTASKLFVH